MEGTEWFQSVVDETEVGARVLGRGGLHVEAESLPGLDDGQSVLVDEGHGGVALQQSQPGTRNKCKKHINWK